MNSSQLALIWMTWSKRMRCMADVCKMYIKRQTWSIAWITWAVHYFHFLQVLEEDLFVFIVVLEKHSTFFLVLHYRGWYHTWTIPVSGHRLLCEKMSFIITTRVIALSTAPLTSVCWWALLKLVAGLFFIHLGDKESVRGALGKWCVAPVGE